MILPVYVYGQPVLRKVAEDITPDYPNLKELIQNMFETMDHADGVGLAAPQIGLPIRVVVVDLDVLSEDYPEYKGFRKAYINAHILEVSGEEVSMEEGCLSLPGIHESVKRGNKIRVQLITRNCQKLPIVLVVFAAILFIIPAIAAIPVAAVINWKSMMTNNCVK